MKSHELLREVFEKCNPKQIAGDLGLSVSLIYKWAEPPEQSGSGAANPLDRVEALLACTQDTRLIQWLCERAGGFFIKNPKAHWPHPEFLVPATNQIVQEFADLLSVIAIAAGDNQISKKKQKRFALAGRNSNRLQRVSSIAAKTGISALCAIARLPRPRNGKNDVLCVTKCGIQASKSELSEDYEI